MIYTLTLNPAIDVTYSSDIFIRGGVNRVKTVRRDPGGKGINVSKTLRNLGEATCACFLSGGPAGRELYDMLIDSGIECTKTALLLIFRHAQPSGSTFLKW